MLVLRTLLRKVLRFEVDLNFGRRMYYDVNNVGSATVNGMIFNYSHVSA